MVSRLGVWHRVSINKSHRPIVDDDEQILYIRDGVGLYQGKAKMVDCQNGRIYLTSRRIVYIDNGNAAQSVAIDLADVSHVVVVERFLRQSPKVKVFLAEQTVKESVQTVDWACPICLFNNHLTNRNLEELPKCVTCGIQASKAVIEKAIAAQTFHKSLEGCPKCTFINHPALKFCEMCGTALKQDSTSQGDVLDIKLDGEEAYTNDTPYVKLSFRKGGETGFANLAREALDNNKWARLVNKGLVNADGRKVQATPPPAIRGAGINSLERLGEQQRRNNEVILSLSLEDLEALMYKAQDLMKLSSAFSKLVVAPTKQYGSTVKQLNIKKSSSLYHSELARHLCEFLMNHELSKPTSIITSQELFANYNRYLTLTQGFGRELVNPTDFNKAIRLMELHLLPVQLKQYQSGLVVLCQALSKQAELPQIIVQYLKLQEHSFKYNKLRASLGDDGAYTMHGQFRGNTIANISDNFHWSSTITTEELEKCIELGLVVVDQHISGTFYYINKFAFTPEDWLAEEESDRKLHKTAQADLLAEQRQISADLRAQHQTLNNLIDLHQHEFGQDSSEPSPEPQSLASQSISELAGLTFT